MKFWGLDWYIWAAIAGGVIVLLVVVTAITVTVVKRKRQHAQATGITSRKNDIMLTVNRTYTVSKRGPVKPGQYKLLAVDESNMTFNIRMGDYVQEYRHNTDVVLSEGDRIAPVSSNVILR